MTDQTLPSTTGATTCEVSKQIRIGNQLEQTARCHLPADHPGMHQAGILDSDDNPIVERWGTLGPASADVAELRYLLDLTDRFDNNDQRARYLLTSNWLRDNGARLSVLAGDW